MIDTPRLLLRRHALDDFDAILAMRTDPEVVRFIGGAVLSPEEVWQRLLRAVGHWSLLGYGLFAVIERETGAMIGEVGLMEARRGLGERFDPFPEAAWVFARQAHGKGYATEAVRAAHDWYRAEHGAGRTVCIINPGNEASLRVAGKLGYSRFGIGSYHDRDVVMLERETD